MVEFDKVDVAKHREVADKLGELGYEVLGGTVSKKKKRFGADVRLRRKKP